MDSAGFFLFCFAIGYVVLWVLVNERRGNENGDWGLLGMRHPGKAKTGERPFDPSRPGRQS